jgi:cytochrome c oxidase cbb3-type subunit I/II
MHARSEDNAALIAPLDQIRHAWITLGITLIALPIAAFAEELSTESKEFTPPDYALFEQGRFVYRQHCAVCHGERGDGQGDMARHLVIKPRNFRLGIFKYRSTPWGKLPTTEDLLRTVKRGRTGTAMGIFSFLPEKDQRAVVEYVKFFSRKWRRAENHAPPVELPPEPAWLSDPSARITHAEAGRKNFQNVCAACHGPDGSGNGPAAAGLRDIWDNPSQPADLRGHLRSGDAPSDIYRVLMTGLNGTPMVSFAHAFSPEEKWDLVAYILSLRSTPAEAEEKP